ncbi:putative bifunctional diguanylate cyclase/phosphodiesterase [Ideonella paludis]|uniref:EAL domain-containing protein n=1 Tax=Ideonella paludis TaxID=1233411 RepID=A0ABS5E160_9BURK|nr:EAL domain-containing protein [Ideonella paludis]MBQ0937123.1 EAL domain-containing protein [Ideonella paludis]
MSQPASPHGKTQLVNGATLSRLQRYSKGAVLWATLGAVVGVNVAAFALAQTGLSAGDQALALAAFSVLAAGLACGWLLLFTRGWRQDVQHIAETLDELAYKDGVTGLFNRHAAMAHLQEAMDAGPLNGHGLSVVTFDLDDFKLINDTLGHAVGDEVLRLVASRLQESLRPGARAYRFGGDEFVVICPCDAGFADPARYGGMVQRALSGLTRLDGHELNLTGSVGVARFPLDGETPQDVVRASDIAMYEAKSRGKGHLVVFAQGLRLATEHRVQLESELRRALRVGEMRLTYQPIVELSTGRVLAAEALLRWQHPERGLLMPSDFIDVAERSGLIVELGGWVLEQAAMQLAHWQRCGLTELHVAVNVSARQLRGGFITRQYDHAVAASQCDPTCLELELTEHTLIEDLDDSVRLLHELRRRGVTLAIDDFGTGLSSLAYLKRLPVGKLKIDRSFVAGLPHDSGDRAIVTAALSVARAMELTVVAEGVETPRQARCLRELGCAQAQGFLYGKPMNASELMALAIAGATEPPSDSRPQVLLPV